MYPRDFSVGLYRTQPHYFNGRTTHVHGWAINACISPPPHGPLVVITHTLEGSFYADTQGPGSASRAAFLTFLTVIVAEHDGRRSGSKQRPERGRLCCYSSDLQRPPLAGPLTHTPRLGWRPPPWSPLSTEPEQSPVLGLCGPLVSFIALTTT